MKFSSHLSWWEGLFLVATGSALVLLFLFGCFVVMSPVILGIGMASGEVVRREVVSPDGMVTALVIADDCGATCGCAIRVDLRISDEVVKEVYRSFKACDAEVIWLNSTEFRIEDSAGGIALVALRDMITGDKEAIE